MTFDVVSETPFWVIVQVNKRLVSSLSASMRQSRVSPSWVASRGTILVLFVAHFGEAEKKES